MLENAVVNQLTGKRPVYLQISDLIARDVGAGRLIDGERLPTEREMAATYGVAVRTLRKSLAQLSEMGLIHSRQGSGNYVCVNKNISPLYSFFRLELVDGSGLPSARLLSVDKLLKPDDLPQFGIETFGHRIRRLRMLGESPVALEEIWLDGSVCDSIETHLVSHSLYKFYRDHLDLWITKAEDRVGVSNVPEWTVKEFALPTCALTACVERFGWSRQGVKVEFSQTWFDTNLARYVSRLK